MNNRLIFNSKKATITVIGAILGALLQIMPIVFPDVDPVIFQEAADLIMKIVMIYLPSQAAVDVAKVVKQQHEQATA